VGYNLGAITDCWADATVVSFTTRGAAPTVPDVTPANLNITTGGTGTFTISLGQSGNEADSATVTSNDTSIATVNPAYVTTSDQAITVTGESAGNTTVTISFSGGSYTGGDKTVSVTVADYVYATHTINFYSNGSLYASKTVTSGSALGTNWPGNPTRSGYSFGGWYTGQNGAGTRYTSSTIINADVDLYAKWTYNGGGGGGSSTPTTPSTQTYKADVKAENGTETTLPVTVDKDAGTASVDAGSQGLDQEGTNITIPSIPDVDTYSVGIPVPDLSTSDVQGTLTVNTDAGNTYYTGYIAAAKRLGITAGVGNNMFAPKKEITRQEMFTLLHNALKVIGQLPQGNSDRTLSDFSDARQIDSWAKEAMTLLVKTGTVGGNNGLLTPLSTTTRTEMAQVLYNLLGK